MLLAHAVSRCACCTSAALLMEIQHHGLMGWPSGRFAVFVWVVERDDPRKHHVYHLSFQHEVREPSLRKYL